MTDARYVGFPLGTGPNGRTATVRHDAYVEQLLEQLLFTAPGERVNRPSLGCGVLELVFDPLTDELATATKFLIQSALQEWLRGVATIESVDFRVHGSEMRVTIDYRVIATGTAAKLERRR